MYYIIQSDFERKTWSLISVSWYQSDVSSHSLNFIFQRMSQLIPNLNFQVTHGMHWKIQPIYYNDPKLQLAFDSAAISLAEIIKFRSLELHSK